ncbi:MAG: HAD family hydrolase [Clostridium sp.]|nr:HAD family hydrolase [Clostridium sp.]
MSKKTHILFDLDGTLTDPKEGITKSVSYALNHYGIHVEDLDSLCPFIGPPLTDSYKKYFNFSHEQAWEAVLKYREYFGQRGWQENKEYPGIREMLRALKDSGRHLMVATSKPEEFALRILDHFGLTEYFEFIGGADMEETRNRKADVIGYVLEQCGLGAGEEAVSRAVMVGDREHDVLGARQWGIETVGVMYGYGGRQELESCGADYMVETVEELRRLLLSL